ncbi:uncharacterized protein LOC112514068 isoform X2 [Cynara cardunculus var. scolymus]|uniref:uncharacterized protein LOC112514068 isoform X2 n=1 Tax=Cynara cardunculus var. scolymus TaxID=59895 RepID=UPI000D62E892|nr:uncharacterized protein LOC112514068 isoform X2 [Cynara cardunculus var. scolymus]
MGALAADFSWTREDEFKLKKAAEAGVSMESLARGVVQFSKRFTIQELQDRWHAILYDPVVAAEASARILEFEQSASARISKSAQLDNIEEDISVSGKRKAESVRQLFYAMRKRMRDHPSNSLDVSFPNTTVNSNGNGNEEHPPAADFVVGEIVQDNQAAGFSTYEAAGHADFSLDVNHHTLHCEHQNCIGDNSYIELHDRGTLVAHTNQDNISLLENDASIEESDEFKEIYDLLEDEGTELPGMIDQPHIDKLNEYPVIRGEGNLHSPNPDCQAAIQNPGPSSMLQKMAVWNTEDPCSSTSPSIHVKEDQRSVARTSDFPGDVYSGVAKLEKQMCGETTTAVTSASSYLMEISNTLFDLAMEDDDLPLMDADGNVIDKSYIDGLSSLLLDSPKADARRDIIVSTMPVVDEFIDNHYAACFGQFGNKNQPQGGHQEAKSLECLLLPSASGMNSKSQNSVIICTLNTEDPEIPSNDDVFLLPLVPFTSPYVMQMDIFQPPPHSTSKSIKDSAVGWKRDFRVPKQIIPKENRYEQSQFPSPIIGSQLRSEILGDNRLKQDLSSSDGQHVLHGKPSLPCEDRSQVRPAIICRSDLFPASEKASATKSEQEMHHCNPVSTLLENKTDGSDIFANSPKLNAVVGNHDMHANATVQKEEILHAEIASTEHTNPILVVRPSPTDEALPSLSDDDIPNFSDVEAMILDEDLSPSEQNLYVNGIESSCHLQTLKYENADTHKMIIRWEQAAEALLKRDMTSRGAFAILQGWHMTYYVKKPEVLVGRATEDVHVDIDLGRDGHNSRVSRRQIRGMPFLFETNEACIKQYVDSIRTKPIWRTRRDEV